MFEMSLSGFSLFVTYTDVRAKVLKGWCDMNKMQVCLVIGIAVLGAAVCRADTKTTYHLPRCAGAHLGD